MRVGDIYVLYFICKASAFLELDPLLHFRSFSFLVLLSTSPVAPGFGPLRPVGDRENCRALGQWVLLTASGADDHRVDPPTWTWIGEPRDGG